MINIGKIKLWYDIEPYMALLNELVKIGQYFLF